MKNKIVNIILTILIALAFISCFIFTNTYQYFTGFIWGVTTVIILSCSFYFSYKLKFPQLNIKKLFKVFKNNNNNNQEIKPIESLMMNLAAKIGVGSLAGVALAIYIGGPGSILWMWISSLLCAINTFTESILGVYYQEKDYDDIYKGGPSYYVKKGLNDNYLAKLYAIMIIGAYIIGFLGVQSNTIVSVVNTTVNINPWIITMTIGVISALVILKGVKRIAKFTSALVPMMGLLYLVLGMVIIIQNISSIPSIIALIFKDAFSLKSLSAGLLGTIIIGIERGIFATETGLGTSAISSACIKENPVNQGYLQIWGVHFTTFIICTVTALIILTSNYTSISFGEVNGIEITSFAFSHHLGNIGIILLSIITILFAFSTIISGYYYGESSLKFLVPNISNKKLVIFKIITITLVIIGGIVKAGMIWKLVDLFVALLSIINLYAIYSLRNVVFKIVGKHQKK